MQGSAFTCLTHVQLSSPPTLKILKTESLVVPRKRFVLVDIDDWDMGNTTAFQRSLPTFSNVEFHKIKF